MASPSVLETIKKQIPEALKAHDSFRLSVLRLLLSSIKNKEIDMRKPLSTDDLLGVLSSQVKMRREASESYVQAGRQDLAEKEQVEIRVIQEFLPKQMTESEISEKIEEALKETGAQSLKDIGKVMAQLMPSVKGRADGKLVNQLVKKRLSAPAE